MARVEPGRVASLTERELSLFEARHPRSRQLFKRGQSSLLAGVPMPWMTEWAGPHPIFVSEARGAHFTDVDGHDYVDFCLGDTGSMTGHAPKEVTDAIAVQAARGITSMLPTEDSILVGEELTRRFGLPYWQFALTATDANRFTIRLARQITGRPRILVFSWCYHGTVDETFVILEHGRARSRPDNVGPPIDPVRTTRVVEWNDVSGLEAALAHRDVACVVAEPAMTNIGIILPDPGFHEALRELTRSLDTLLVIDETHTLCAGPGGYTREHNLEPDFLSMGKPLGAGIPAAAYGMSAEAGERVTASLSGLGAVDVGGIGGTLSGNALSLAAMRATLDSVLTDEAFARMIALGERFEAGVTSVIDDNDLPWHATRLGCRVEYRFRGEPPRNGGQAAAANDPALDRLMHLYALNRGILMTPFHNMALMCPATNEADVDRHTGVFAQAVDELVA